MGRSWYIVGSKAVPFENGHVLVFDGRFVPHGAWHPNPQPLDASGLNLDYWYSVTVVA